MRSRAVMAAPLVVDPNEGAVSIGGRPELLVGGIGLDRVQATLAPFISTQNEWDGGGHHYHRVECAPGDHEDHLTFGDWRCGFVATTQDARLLLLYWDLWPPKGAYWPAGGATEDDQLWVLQSTLRAQLSRPFEERAEYFGWGYAWCGPELHSGRPHARIHYGDADS